MGQFLKAYWKTLVFFAVIGLVGGFFVGLYLIDSYPPAIQQQLIDQMKAEGLDQIPLDLFLGFVSAILSAGYGLRYAMIAHGGCHVISKLIWILFI